MTIVLATEPASRRAATNGAIVATPLVLTPEGSTFGKVLELTIPISPSSLPSGRSIDDVVVLTAPHGSDVYVPLPTRRNGNAVVATTTHFSDFVAVVPPAPIDPADEACVIPTTSWAFNGAMTTTRSILVHAPSVYAISDGPGTTISLFELSIDSGNLGTGAPTLVDRPQSPLSTHFPRLQTASYLGEEQLFVSYLSGQYDPGTGVTEYWGGVVRVGPTSVALPASASLIAGNTESIDGIYSDVAGPRAIRWLTLASTTATLATLSQTGGVDAFDAGIPFTASTTPFERAQAIHAGESLVGFVRANDDDSALVAEHWSGWVFDGTSVGAPLALPGTITTFAAHDTLPFVYAVDTSGTVTEYSVDPSFTLVTRVVAHLPAGYSAAGSSAKMAYSNGSIVFPAWNGSSARLLRVHTASGRIDEWIEPDATVIGWSALTVDDGVVCYAANNNTVRCGCLAGVFTAVP